ncbi:MBL fold metallo-hydrolase [Nitrosomonas communis]|uniref:MBL fold metallo-hydrolase n=1 Tax=Nitrosomonas communis TaxID=44574 RepID=UPI003D29BB2A
MVEVAPGILRAQLPIALPGLGHVNCYLLQDSRGVAVVDPGLPGPQSWRALVARLKQAGYSPRHVHTVVVTHSHPDHFGGAGRLRDSYGAEVIGHRRFRTWFDPAEDDLDDELHAANGHDTSADRPAASGPTPTPWGRTTPWRTDAPYALPLRRRLKMGLYRTALKRFVSTPSPTRRVDDAEVITLGGREWVAMHTPGHTADHLCLLDPADGVLLSGDHVLPTITPHIPGHVAGADPLSDFFASLDKVGSLTGVGLVLPAHGHPFPDLTGRTDEIRQHHEERLDTLRAAAADLGSATVEELSHRLFKRRSWGQMAESETYAHLEHLRAAGEAAVRNDGGLLRYELTG